MEDPTGVHDGNTLLQFLVAWWVLTEGVQFTQLPLGGERRRSITHTQHSAGCEMHNHVRAFLISVICFCFGFWKPTQSRDNEMRLSGEQ